MKNEAILLKKDIGAPAKEIIDKIDAAQRSLDEFKVLFGIHEDKATLCSSDQGDFGSSDWGQHVVLDSISESDELVCAGSKQDVMPSVDIGPGAFKSSFNSSSELRRRKTGTTTGQSLCFFKAITPQSPECAVEGKKCN